MKFESTTFMNIFIMRISQKVTNEVNEDFLPKLVLIGCLLQKSKYKTSAHQSSCFFKYKESTLQEFSIHVIYARGWHQFSFFNFS